MLKIDSPSSQLSARSPEKYLDTSVVVSVSLSEVVVYLLPGSVFGSKMTPHGSFMGLLKSTFESVMGGEINDSSAAQTQYDVTSDVTGTRRDDRMEDVEFFLNSLKDEANFSGMVAEALVESPEAKESRAQLDTDSAVHGQEERATRGPLKKTASSRRESRIWDGDFVQDKATKRKRMRSSSGEDDSRAPKNINIDGGASLQPRTSPGIWISEFGRSSSSITTFTFKVSRECADAARKWNERPDDLHPEADHLRIDLCCSSKSVLSKSELTEGGVLEKIQSAESAWSSTCVYIEFGDRVWSPFNLDSQEGPLDISAFVKEGINEFRIIQITDASDLVFLVMASHPSAQQLMHAKKKKRFQQIVRSRAILRPGPSSLSTPVAP